MNIEEMRNHEWVVSWSGGKDSTATIILMHEHNIPIKKIVYIKMMFDDDTPATLPVMTEFVNKAADIFRSWGYQVDIVKSSKTAMQLANKIYQKSKTKEKNGKPYGMTAFYRGHCKFQGIKQGTAEEQMNKNDYQMIGYAADEIDRLHRLTDKKQSIMATLGVKEYDTFEICRTYNLLSPLYELGILRDGCFFCPCVSKKEIQLLSNDYQKLVRKIYRLIEMQGYSTEAHVPRNNWLKKILFRKTIKR